MHMLLCCIVSGEPTETDRPRDHQVWLPTVIVVALMLVRLLRPHRLRRRVDGLGL
jgi:hypothetical protein